MSPEDLSDPVGESVVSYRILCLFLLLACADPEPIEPQVEDPQLAPAIPLGVTAKAALVERQQQLHRRLDAMENAAENRSSEIRVAWSVALQRLEWRTGEFGKKVDQMDPEAVDWEQVSRTLGAELDTLEKQLDAELGALQRGR